MEIKYVSKCKEIYLIWIWLISFMSNDIMVILLLDYDLEFWYFVVNKKFRLPSMLKLI